MATTTILTIHINKGKTPKQCVAAQLNYIMNPTKTNGGALISSHACMPETAVNEFMLYRQEYFENTGREIENEVLVYHVRQAFKPEEITPEEANEIGKELASRMTDDQFAYVVATHIDKHHVHNHIVICSTALDCQHKYRDVKRSGKDLAQLSDEICEEHQLSVIRDPQNKTVSYDKWQGNQRKLTHRDELRMIIDAALRMQPDGFDALMQLLEDAGCCIKRGAHISIKPPEGERYIRLDTLGPEYDEASLRRTLAHDHVHIPKIPRGDFTESQVKRLIDIKDEVIQVVEAALNALNNQSAPAREPEHLDNSTSQQSSPGTKMTLSVREAAELIGISKPKMYELIHSNEIPSIHVGKKIVIARQALMDWLSEGDTNGKKAC